MKLLEFFGVKAVLSLVLGLSLLHSYGQNLISNPSFEDDNICDKQQVNPGFIDFRILPKGWRSATSDSATAYYRCYFGNDPKFSPRSGDGFAHGSVVFQPALNRDSRTFLQTRLISPLEQGCTYEVSFYIKPYGKINLDGSPVPSDYVFAKGLGVFLSRERISESGSYNSFLNYKPQIQTDFFITDTTKYTQISGTLISTGGEEYLTVGFFIPGDGISCKMTSGNLGQGDVIFPYRLEGFSVQRIPSAPTYKKLLPNDTVIAVGDAISLSTGNSLTFWSTGVTASAITINTPGKYWAMIEDNCFIYLDTIDIRSEKLVVHIPNAFTPNNDGVNDFLEFWIYGVEKYNARIYNRWGQMVYAKEGGPGKFSWDGKVNGKELMSGVYSLQIITDDKQRINERIHLIR